MTSNESQPKPLAQCYIPPKNVAVQGLYFIALQVIELLSMEDVDLTSDQIADIVSLLKREEQILGAAAKEDKQGLQTP